MTRGHSRPVRVAWGTFAALVSGAQGLYYAATGAWANLHLSSFQAVTGPKTDLWLVRTVGLLVLVTGVALVSASWRRRITLEIGLIAAGQALALATIDIVFVAAGRIRSIYLADAVIELALVAAWIWIAFRARGRRR